MKKKIYEKPLMKVIKIQQTHILCGSPDGAPEKWGGADPNNPYDFD
jgi:hypothetical protein